MTARRLWLPIVSIVLAVQAFAPQGAEAAEPRGWIDHVGVVDGVLSVEGWVADPDTADAAGIHVYVDGSFVFGGPATLPRPDVDRATGLGTHRGFELTGPIAAGSRDVCVYGIDRTGDRNVLLGCRPLASTGVDPEAPAPTPPPPSSGGSPFGWLEAATAGEGTVVLRGWAMDPDTSDPIGIHVYVDGRFSTGFRADGTRPDVERVHGNGADHGFKKAVPMTAGRKTVCVYGIDRTGDRNSLIRCAVVVIPFPAGAGAVVTDAGVVMPVIGDDGVEYQVMTACTNTDTVPVSAVTLVERAQVVIDPGHGGSESGAVANGLVEKTLNLDISRRVESMLEAKGYSVLLTRYTDYRLPLRTRGAIAEAVGADLFISIHHNGGATSRVGRPGTMTLYQHDLPESRRLAMLLYEDMTAMARQYPTSWVSNSLTGASSRLSSTDVTFYGVHKYTPTIPSVITEWGYITNPDEAGQLKTETVKNAEARAIVNAIERWYETADSGVGDLGTWTNPTSTGTGGTSGCTDPAIP